jgi:hypothetical protein
MGQCDSNDIEDGNLPNRNLPNRNLPNRNENDINNRNSSACFTNNSDELSSDSDITKIIKDSIARSNHDINDVSFETKVRHIAETTSDIISEMPKIASRTVQIANKIVSVGKDSLNSINQIKNSVSLNRHE